MESLRQAGVEVFPYFRANDELRHFSVAGKASVPLRLFHSPTDVRAFRRLLREVKPDVVHLHNPYPLISPSVIRVAKAEQIPVVHTVHNYQHVCAAQMYFRLDTGRDCRLCAGRRIPTPAVRHACYHESRIESAAMAAAIVAARPAWRMVDRFLPISEPIAEHLVQFGIPRERITVKPNSLPDPGPPTPPGTGFLLACRLRTEKGVRVLLRAWELARLDSSHTLTIAGDGPDREHVEAATRTHEGIDYVGMVPHQTVQELMRRAAVVVQPSQWQEPFAMTTIEAMAHGRPLIATSMGGMRYHVDSEVGWSVAPDAESIAQALREATHADLAALGRAARRRYESRFSPRVVTAQLIGVYEELAAARRAA
jgi:glycosyltransferase involved in cell wall biosynthesis